MSSNKMDVYCSKLNKCIKQKSLPKWESNQANKLAKIYDMLF